MSLTAVTSANWCEVDPDDRVLLLLHGYGSHERDLASLAPYLPHGLAWASVRAPLEMGYGGAAWFPLDGDWLDPAPIERATEQLWDWIDANISAQAPIGALGFSQGALMASQLLRTRPERIGHTVMCSGFVLDAPQPGDAALAAAKPAVFWGRGDADPVVPAQLFHAAEVWLGGHTTAEAHVYPGLTHSINDRELADVRAYLNR